MPGESNKQGWLQRAYVQATNLLSGSLDGVTVALDSLSPMAGDAQERERLAAALSSFSGRHTVRQLSCCVSLIAATANTCKPERDVGLFVNSAFDSGNIAVRRLPACSTVAVGQTRG